MDSRRRITNTKSAEESSFLSEPSKELTPPKGRPDWRLTYTFVDWAPYIDSDFHVVNKGETHLVRRIRSWTPSLTTALKLLIAFRLIPAVWLHITDCDETYNYWDPLHYLLYGSGFETWEYSPTYAIRSYAYLLIHALPLRLFQFISGINRDHLFFLLRTILSASCALCELYFYNGVRQKFGNSAARVVLLIQLFAPGMFIAAPAFLPSSFALCCSLVSLGALFHRHRFIAVAATAVGALLGWPFAAITGVPVALELVRTGRLRYLIAYALLSGGVCGAAILLVDSYYYGRVAFPPLSIVLYNVFSSQHGGSELYGVEPWTYYIFNLILNYNVAALLSIAFLLLLIPAAFILRWPFMLFVDMISILSGFLLWLLIFFMQPHKEERFLFPIYPLIAFCASLALLIFEKLLWRLSFPRIFHSLFKASLMLILLVFITLSLSRIALVLVGFRAPLLVYSQLPHVQVVREQLADPTRVRLCLGREWYRHHSAFLLPPDWELAFIKSGFTGQLPKPFESAPPNGSRLIPSNMNHLNLEEPTRYVPVNSCDFMVDMDRYSDRQFEPNYSFLKDEWEVIYSIPYLDLMNTHRRLYRAFYIPVLSARNAVFVNYNLLRAQRGPLGSSNRGGPHTFRNEHCVKCD